MAESENSPASSKTSNFKNLIITVLTAILITGGLVAAFGNFLKGCFIDLTTIYRCNLNLKNGPNKTLSSIVVMLNSDSDKRSESTDNYGNVIFKVKKDVYKISFSFGNKPYVRNCSVVSDTTLTIDIGDSLTNPVTGETVKSDLAQPSKKVSQKTVKEAPKSIRITTTQKDQPATPPVIQPTTTIDSPKIKPIDVKLLSANEILEQLQLEVRINKSDSYNNRKKQFAYHYYLAGKKEYLDQIKEVLYQRNHSTFPEFQDNRFNVSNERNLNFEYVGYQWGSISTTYVQIILNNGLKSDIFLKDILNE